VDDAVSGTEMNKSPPGRVAGRGMKFHRISGMFGDVGLGPGTGFGLGAGAGFGAGVGPGLGVGCDGNG